jgi:hypothetical protein
MDSVYQLIQGICIYGSIVVIGVVVLSVLGIIGNWLKNSLTGRK